MRVKPPLITVAIPTLNREEVLIDSVNDVLAQGFKDIEVLVVDQTPIRSKKITDFLANNKDKRLRYYHTAPASLPAARNFCLDKATAPIILFIDDDVRLPKDFVAQHLKTHEAKPDIAVVAGRVKQEGVPFTHTLTHFNKYGFQTGWFNCPDAQYCETFPGGNFSVQTKALKEVGGFDPSYMANALREESDAALRLKRAGYKFYFNPDAYIIHLAAPSGGTRIHTHQFNNLEFYKNDLLFTLKYVDGRRLPLAITKKYGRYVYTTYIQKRKYQTFPLFFLRNLYFVVGLTVAIKRYFIPVTIVQLEVER